jgi:predicted Zn-dependent peptidase
MRSTNIVNALERSINAAIAEAVVAERRRIAAKAREMGATYANRFGYDLAFADFIEDTMLDDDPGGAP